MAGYIEGSTRTFQANAAMATNLRVKFSSGKLVLAVLADRELGTLERAAFAADERVAVRLRTAPGTQLFVASAAFAVGALVYTAAGGKVGPSASGAFLIGEALTAASGDNSELEVLRFGSDAATV